MPRARALVAYPNDTYWALVNRAHSTQGPVLIPCTRPIAAGIRAQLYAWRTAIEANPAEAELIGIDPKIIRAVSYRITDSGLEAIPTSHLPGVQAIQAALGAIPALKTPASEALDRLRQLGAGDGEE